MKRTEVRDILIENGLENPSKALLDSLLDAFHEEIETLKVDKENFVSKDEYEKVRSDFEELTNKYKDVDLEKLQAENVEYKKNAKLLKIKNAKIQDEFADYILTKIDGNDEEFDGKLDAFVKDEKNQKFLTSVKTIETNPVITNAVKPIEGNPYDMNKAVGDFYNQK